MAVIRKFLTFFLAGFATMVSAADAPPEGTMLTYQIIDTESGYDTWHGAVQSGELQLADGGKRSLYPGCLLHCDAHSQPIAIEDYNALLPLEVGRTVDYARRTSDGSKAWKHRATIQEKKEINTAMGFLEVIQIVTYQEGDGHEFKGKTVSYWSPELGATVYELSNDLNGSWKSTVTLIGYVKP